MRSSSRGVSEMVITKGQIQLVKIAQKELGIDDDDYRDILLRMFRVSSCTQLTKDQATRLIEHFQSLGFETRPGGNASKPGADKGTSQPRQKIPRKDGTVIRLASAGEHRKISVLCRLVDWRVEGGYLKWAKKWYGISRVRTAQDAYLVIEGLKKLIANQMAAKHGKDWWVQEFEDEAIERFIREHRPEEYR